MSGAKKMLTISREKTAVPARPAFTAMLNPAKYTRTTAVSYTEPENAPKGKGGEPKVAGKPADKIDFDELVFDGTGIVDAPAGTGDVDTQVKALHAMLTEPGEDGNVVTSVVDIVWGTLIFRGRMTSMTVDYTLFDAAGIPLRARVKLSFVAYGQGLSHPATGPSRPLTRQLRAVEGDSLPLLCFTAYNDGTLAQAVALFNGLTTFRKLAPGLALTLPKPG